VNSAADDLTEVGVQVCSVQIQVRGLRRLRSGPGVKVPNIWKVTSVLHTFLLILAGLVLVGVLSAILEQLGMRNHPYASRILAAAVVGVAAYLHTWVRLLIGIAAVILYLLIRRSLEERQARRKTGESQ
jgi:uncharacterized membrane protein YuzA (DUF378 family)